MTEQSALPDIIDPDTPIFSVSVAAALADMHPQTLRSYDRMGLVVPQRTKGGGRRYTPRDVNRLRLIQRLSQAEGINLNGIKRIVELTNQLDAQQHRIDELTELVSQLLEDASRRSRVFTASSSGSVYQGRRVRQQLALPGC